MCLALVAGIKILQYSATLSRPTAAEAPGDLLEIRTLRLHPRPPESETVVGPSDLCFTNSDPGDADSHRSLRLYC